MDQHDTTTSPTATGEPNDSDEKDDASGGKSLLEQSDLLDRAASLMTRLGLRGEETNRRMVFLAGIGGVLGEPIHLIVHGGSSGGKNTLVKKALTLLPEDRIEMVSSLSKRALEHRGGKIEGVLVIDEAEGAIDAEYALRQAMSEGRIRRLSVDPNTHAPADRNVEITASVITTTTAPAIHEENQTRVFDLWVDESEGQTREVLDRIAKEAAGKTNEVDIAELEEWRNALGELHSQEVVIPFAEDLTKAFPARVLRARRDFRRMITLIEAHALLYQRQRETTPRGELTATLQDYAAVRPLVQAVLGQSMTGLNETALKLADLHDELAKDTPDGWVRRIDLQEEAGKRGIASKNTVHKWARRLSELGIWQGQRRKSRAWEHYKIRDARTSAIPLPEPENLSGPSPRKSRGGRSNTSVNREPDESPSGEDIGKVENGESQASSSNTDRGSSSGTDREASQKASNRRENGSHHPNPEAVVNGSPVEKDERRATPATRSWVCLEHRIGAVGEGGDCEDCEDLNLPKALFREEVTTSQMEDISKLLIELETPEQKLDRLLEDCRKRSANERDERIRKLVGRVILSRHDWDAGEFDWDEEGGRFIQKSRPSGKGGDE